ncbi:MAG: hypothetical protein ACTHK4_12545 [Mycobacteriales bacterium]
MMIDDRSADSGHREFDLALRLLSDGVPLSLLIDLATPPHSDEIYRAEAGDAEWLVAAPA